MEGAPRAPWYQRPLRWCQVLLSGCSRVVQWTRGVPGIVFLWFFKSYRGRSSDWRKCHFQHFVDHAKGYAPTILIALMALMLGGWGHHHKVAEFLVFTVATVSVEVCFACQRAKERRNKMLSRNGRLTPKEDNDLGLCKIIVGVVVCLWLLVAICEVGTIIQWPELPESSTWIAIWLSGTTCAIAARKMWNHAIELAEEDFPDEPREEAKGEKKMAEAFAK